MLVVASVLAAPHVARAADAFPVKPIRLIVPFAPGGVADTGARIVAERLGTRLGTTITVDNRPGAGGNTGAQIVANASPDGYTLLLGFDGTLVINPHVYPAMPFDTLKDFAPISKIGDAVLVIIVNPSVPARTFAELVAYSKTQPDGLSYGTSGVGSTPHLGAELLKLKTGAKFVHVPYKGGGQAMTDVVGGNLPMLYTAVISAYPFITKGSVRAIAVSSAKRVGSLPDVPTVAESGVPGFEVSSWIGLLAPAKTPQPIIDRLQQELRTVVQSPDIKARFEQLGIVVSGNTPAEFGQQIKTDLQRYSDIVKSANIKME